MDSRSRIARMDRVVMREVLAVVLLVATASACAQVYPAKAIRMIMPFPPGGPTDIVGRLIAGRLSDQIGQPVVAESRPGAGGNVGLEVAAKSAPDGYTVVLSSPVIALGPLLYSKLNFDPWKDLAPISLVGAVRNVLVLNPTVPAKTIGELVQLARSKPGILNYGSGGVATGSHLAPELLKSLEKLDILHVPYKGTGQALIGLASGQVDMLVIAVPAVRSHIETGRVRAIAVLSPNRINELPAVASSKEQGFEAFELLSWYGILAPAATPRAIIDRLHSELVRVVSAADMKPKLAQAGIEPLTSSPEEFGNFIRQEAARFAKVIKDAGINGE